MRENRKSTSIYIDKHIWFLTKQLAMNLSRCNYYINPVDIVENALLQVLKDNQSKLSEKDISVLNNIQTEIKI